MDSWEKSSLFLVWFRVFRGENKTDMSGHGGNLERLAAAAGLPPAAILDFSANLNPLGPPEWLRPVVSRCVSELVHYPDPDCRALREALARALGVTPAEVVAGNGSNELLYALPRALNPARMLLCTPCYGDYEAAAVAAGVPVAKLPLAPESGFQVDPGRLAAAVAAGDLVVVGTPNNPTGALPDLAALLGVAQRHPAAFFALDEAFLDFLPDTPTAAGRSPQNVIVLRSLTKFYAIPGLRLGCCVAATEVAARIRAVLPDWSVNRIAQEVGRLAVQDAEYARATRELVGRNRRELAAALGAIPGCTLFPGTANYLFGRLDGAVRAGELATRLLRRHGIAIRVCDNYDGLDERYFRVAVRTAAENGRLLAAMHAELGAAPAPEAAALPDEAPRPAPLPAAPPDLGPALFTVRSAPAVGTPRRRRTPAIMFQGTSSNAGKSVLTAAVCRILLQDGLRVAPFKAQNMSLNSYVTASGGEIGRAQALQAQACRLEPDVRMNPILLKPNSDTGSQVILRGKAVANMDVRRYGDYKAEAIRAVLECYDSLAAEHDAIILEGAGSPGEINLKRHDLVNMAMARYAAAPVLLVGDIDRGGVYAAFVGTLEVLAEWERELVAGFVVNRFRGDASLLQDAHDYLLNHTGRPVLGVVPYLKNLGLPEEDSVEFKSGRTDPAGAATAAGRVTIAVVDLPHISNFTDIDAFRGEPDVQLKIARRPADLANADAIILPGSKNTIGDLAHLRATGFAERIGDLARRGAAEVVGICGGFQMLGRTVHDPGGVESDGRPVPGLALLDVATVMAPEKTLARTRGVHLASGLEVAGYEIHHGQTAAPAGAAAIRAPGGGILGVASPEGTIWGTYLHGVFDADAFRRWFLDRLRTRKGLPPLGQVCARYDIEPALDRLAEVVRASLDMNALHRLLGR